MLFFCHRGKHDSILVHIIKAYCSLLQSNMIYNDIVPLLQSNLYSCIHKYTVPSVQKQYDASRYKLTVPLLQMQDVCIYRHTIPLLHTCICKHTVPFGKIYPTSHWRKSYNHASCNENIKKCVVNVQSRPGINIMHGVCNTSSLVLVV